MWNLLTWATPLALVTVAKMERAEPGTAAPMLRPSEATRYVATSLATLKTLPRALAKAVRSSYTTRSPTRLLCGTEMQRVGMRAGGRKHRAVPEGKASCSAWSCMYHAAQTYLVLEVGVGGCQQVEAAVVELRAQQSRPLALPMKKMDKAVNQTVQKTVNS